MERNPRSSTYGAFEALQASYNDIRRARPEEIEQFAEANQLPSYGGLHRERLGKRESRINLKTLFSRSKAGHHAKDSDRNSSIRESSRPMSILAEIGNWPHALHNARSEALLANTLVPPSSSRSTPALRSQSSSVRLRSSPSSPPSSRSSKASSAAWDPIPLFQVYSQSIRHATLPACTLTADALLRLSNNRSSVIISDELSLSSLSLGNNEDGEGKEKRRRRHQRNAGSKNILEWTRKIYVLVTSGYLMQYAAEGPYDRLPEQILPLTKDSAVFACDLIPGRHWVLQVASHMDPDGQTMTDTRSLLHKLSLRGTEKKSLHASNMILVLQGVEDMDSWLATLRGAIESMGGKKKKSETGVPITEDTPGTLRTQPSQRTLVVRDPERFSHVVAEDFSWRPKDDGAGMLSMVPPERTPELPQDDVSTIASHVSSDAQRLDSLRDSTNRLSFISSGQRTFITSAGSSPACSPTRTSFSSHPDDWRLPEHHQPDVRMRPNAQAIATRRQSMQKMISGFDYHVDPDARRQSVLSNESNGSDAHSIPNFSVPQTSNKRYSMTRPLSSDSALDESPVYSPDMGLHGKSGRKPPPTALSTSRPLSIVVDQPSPMGPWASEKPVSSVSVTENQISDGRARAESTDSPTVSFYWAKETSDSPPGPAPPSQDSTFFIDQQESPVVARPTVHRPPVSMRNGRGRWRSSSNASSESVPSGHPTTGAPAAAPLLPSPDLRMTSGPGSSGNRSNRRFSAAPTPLSRSLSSRGTPPERHSVIGTSFFFSEPASPSQKSLKEVPESPVERRPGRLLLVDAQNKALMSMKSMPQLGEPPLPPPTCALPPLPPPTSALPPLPPPTCALPPVPMKRLGSTNGSPKRARYL